MEKESTIRTLTEKVIRAAYTVHNALGPGFLEKVYENAMLIELREAGLRAESQYPVQVYYKGKLIGDYYADLFVENVLIVELKAVERQSVTHEVQLVNYLSGTNTEHGLLINFGSSVTIRHKYKTYRKTDKETRRKQ